MKLVSRFALANLLMISTPLQGYTHDDYDHTHFGGCFGDNVFLLHNERWYWNQPSRGPDGGWRYGGSFRISKATIDKSNYGSRGRGYVSVPVYYLYDSHTLDKPLIAFSNEDRNKICY